VFPESRRKYSHFMSETVANDLRGWLVEPDFAINQREPLKLDSNQQSLVTVWPASGYKRIKGPAGSGKSFGAGGKGCTPCEPQKDRPHRHV
jgi:hypothetical protein